MLAHGLLTFKGLAQSQRPKALLSIADRTVAAREGRRQGV